MLESHQPLIIMLGVFNVPNFGWHKPKFPYRLCKGDHLLKDCPGLSIVSKVWSKNPMSSVSDHHADDSQSTNDSLVKSRKGKVRYPFLLCKDMHLTYLCPHMDEASNLLEYIIVPRQQFPIGYHKLSLDIPLVDQVVDPIHPWSIPLFH